MKWCGCMVCLISETMIAPAVVVLIVVLWSCVCLCNLFNCQIWSFSAFSSLCVVPPKCSVIFFYLFGLLINAIFVNIAIFCVRIKDWVSSSWGDKWTCLTAHAVCWPAGGISSCAEKKDHWTIKNINQEKSVSRCYVWWKLCIWILLKEPLKCIISKNINITVFLWLSGRVLR